VNASRQANPSPETAFQHDADFAGLGREIAVRLAELEAALDQAPLDADAIRHRVAEIRALLTQQADSREELASLTDFLQTRNEREKAALSRELHDSLGGILTPAKMDVAWLEERLADDPQYGARVRRLSSLIDQGIDLKRRIIEALRPSLLDHLGLASALQWYVDETCRQHQLECDVHIAEDIGRFTPDLEIALYRLVQDCLANTVRHAKAKCFDLTLHRTPEGLHLELADDGVGIDDLRKAKGLSHGLANMMHRVRSVHGTFQVESGPGAGTRITVFVPA
jgi:signal transduction histidine kinase